MAEEAERKSRGKIVNNVIPALILCGIVYLAVPLYKLADEIEGRRGLGPGPADEMGLLGFGALFSLLLIVGSAFISGFLRSRDVSYRVVSYALVPTLGIFVFQIYSRSRLVLFSYLSSKCYQSRGESPDSPRTITCSNGLNLTWDDLKPFSGLRGDFTGVLTGLVAIQSVCLLLFLLFFAAFKADSMRADRLLLAANSKSKSPFKGVTVADLNLKPVVTVKTSATSGAVIDLLEETGFDQIPVVSDKSETLVGLVTHGNLLSYILRGRGTVDTPVSQVVTDLSRQSAFATPCVTAKTPLGDLRRLFEQSSAVVVTESTSDGVKAVHVVTKLDLLDALVE